jgi:hypothetical protein
MSDCGNRAKARRFHAKKQAANPYPGFTDVLNE